MVVRMKTPFFFLIFQLSILTQQMLQAKDDKLYMYMVLQI